MTDPKDKLGGKQLAVIDGLVGSEMNETAVLAAKQPLSLRIDIC